MHYLLGLDVSTTGSKALLIDQAFRHRSSWIDLIDALGLQRHPVLKWGPVGMQMLSETREGGLGILGFAGNSAPDHVDHFHGLAVFLGMVLDEG